jgi:hypothetical protein
MFLNKILATYIAFRGQPEILKHKKVIDSFDILMKAGGKGFCTFLLSYSLA